MSSSSMRCECLAYGRQSAGANASAEDGVAVSPGERWVQSAPAARACWSRMARDRVQRLVRRRFSRRHLKQHRSRSSRRVAEDSVATTKTPTENDNGENQTEALGGVGMEGRIGD